MMTPMSTKAVISKALPMAIMISRSNISHTPGQRSVSRECECELPPPPPPPSHLATTVCFLQRGDTEPKPQSLPYAWNLPRSLASQSGPRWVKGLFMDEKGLKEKVQRERSQQKTWEESFPFTGGNMQLSVKNKPVGEERVLIPTTWVSWNTCADKSQDWPLALQQI